MNQEIDIKLLNRIRQNDSQAFELLFKKYYAPLCLFATNYTNDLDNARDVVQNLFVYLWENRATVHIVHSVKAYLVSAARRNSIRLIKQHRATLSINMLPEDSHLADNLHDSLELDELYTQLLEAIEQLPEQCKRIFKLSRFEEMKYAEIASTLHISVKTVEAQMSKALKQLRKRFKIAKG